MHLELGTGIQIHIAHDRGSFCVVLVGEANLVTSVHPSRKGTHSIVHPPLDKREDRVDEHGHEECVANCFPPGSIEVTVMATG